jgi:hypothetical protein
MDSKNKLIIGLYKDINEFKKCYQLRINIVKNENGDLADSHYFDQMERLLLSNYSAGRNACS